MRVHDFQVQEKQARQLSIHWKVPKHIGPIGKNYMYKWNVLGLVVLKGKNIKLIYPHIQISKVWAHDLAIN